MAAELMGEVEAEEFLWRAERTRKFLRRSPWTATVPACVLDTVATGVAAERLHPTEFEDLVEAGCDPVLALEILR